MTETVTPNDVVAARVRDLRRQRGWSVRQLAERCVAVGAAEITDNVIENIERGQRTASRRRGRDVTVDQLVALGYAFEVSPLLLLLPVEADADYKVTDQVSASAYHVGRWLQGQRPLPLKPALDETGAEVIHPGANFVREREFYAALPSYLQPVATQLTPELEAEITRLADARIRQRLDEAMRSAGYIVPEDETDTSDEDRS